jgi:hypothetical protein
MIKMSSLLLCLEREEKKGYRAGKFMSMVLDAEESKTPAPRSA